MISATGRYPVFGAGRADTLAALRLIQEAEFAFDQFPAIMVLSRVTRMLGLRGAVICSAKLALFSL